LLDFSEPVDYNENLNNNVILDGVCCYSREARRIVESIMMSFKYLIVVIIFLLFVIFFFAILA